MFFYFPIVRLQLSRLPVFGIVQQHVNLTHRPKQTSQETLGNKTETKQKRMTLIFNCYLNVKRSAVLVQQFFMFYKALV